jgi:hypothetical protein
LQSGAAPAANVNQLWQTVSPCQILDQLARFASLALRRQALIYSQFKAQRLQFLFVKEVG